MSRGLAGEVPGPVWCKKMAGVPALAEAFKKSACLRYKHYDGALLRENQPGGYRPFTVAAPTVREMLAWLLDQKGRVPMIFESDRKYMHGIVLLLSINGRSSRHDITDPDDLARACIAVSGKGQG